MVIEISPEENSTGRMEKGSIKQAPVQVSFITHESQYYSYFRALCIGECLHADQSKKANEFFHELQTEIKKESCKGGTMQTSQNNG